MASSNYDLKQNVDAVTHFLDVLNERDAGASQSQSAPIDEGASAAAMELVRLLRDSEQMPLDEVMAKTDASFLEVSEAIARLGKAGAIESTEAEGKQSLSLTEEGQRLATVVDKAPFAS